MTRESKDIESKNDETTQLTHGGNSDIRNIEKKCCKQETLWTCMIFCPIWTCVLAIFIVLSIIIFRENIKEDDRDDKVILISKPWIRDGIPTHCDTDNPCNVTCYDYIEATDFEPEECEFSGVIRIICSFILGICSGTIIFQVCKYSCGYICFKCSKSKQAISQRSDI